MTRFTRLYRTVGVGLAVTTATLAMTQAADAAQAPPVDTTKITPTSGKVFLVGHGKGVQTYRCTASADNTTFTWAFVEPQADLIDDNGKLIVTHSQGPTWTAVPPDGTAVKLAAGKTAAKVDSPAPTRDIPWLLVPVEAAPNSATTGLLAGTTSVQRLNTQGGTPPPNAECKAQTVNKEVSVPYKADYFFWK